MLIGIDGNEANVRTRVGTGQYAFELLWQFVKDKRHQFIVYLKDKPLPDLPKPIASFQYKVLGPRKFWTQLALPLHLIVNKRTSVYFSTAHYLPRICPVPQVVTIHDLSFLHYSELFKKSDLIQLTFGTKASIKKATHIIAVSQTTKDDIVKNYNVAPSKITVTYEGYDKDRFKPQSKYSIDRMKKKYKISSDYIIFVGTLQPRKNLERLLEAFKILVHSSPFDFAQGRQFTVHRNKKTVNRKPITDNLLLVIVGKKGWLYDSIFKKVKTLGLQNKVIFTDYVSDTDLPVLISGARAYVLPSLWEGFGIPVIEAQACGVPVVVSNTSSLPEIVGANSLTPEVKSGRHPENTPGVDLRCSAILINPESIQSIADGIKKTLDPKIRSDLVKNGFSNIKHFSWQKCAKITLQVLEKVASEKTS